MVLVDTCRECEFKDINRGSKEAQSFLQAYTHASNTIIGYACALNKTASDGSTDSKNGTLDKLSFLANQTREFMFHKDSIDPTRPHCAINALCEVKKYIK